MRQPNRETVYKTAIETYVVQEINPETYKLVDVTKYPDFYSWENDIIK